MESRDVWIDVNNDSQSKVFGFRAPRPPFLAKPLKVLIIFCKQGAEDPQWILAAVSNSNYIRVEDYEPNWLINLARSLTVRSSTFNSTAVPHYEGDQCASNLAHYPCLISNYFSRYSCIPRLYISRGLR